MVELLSMLLCAAPFLLVIGYSVYLARRRAQLQIEINAKGQATAGYQAGYLAQHLGLTLVEGDPAFNLMMRAHTREHQWGARFFRPVDLRLRMVGTIDGAPVELRYLYAQKKSLGVLNTQIQTWLDCRVTAQPAEPFPPFEVVSRQTTRGPIIRQTGLPQRPSGRSDVDGMLAIATQEPAMAQVLGEAMHLFSPLAGVGVHIVGDGSQISFMMHEKDAPLIDDALPHIAAILAGLADLARRVGG